jgi:hypothetical protein
MEMGLEYSKLRGSEGLWPIAEGYMVRNGVITVEPSQETLAWLGKLSKTPTLLTQEMPAERVQFYAPFGHPELPPQFSKLKCGEEKAVLDFVRRWGLLGRNQLATFFDFRDKPDEAHRHSKETIDWIVYHACTVEMLLFLLNCRHESREKKDSKILWDGLMEVMRRAVLASIRRHPKTPTPLADKDKRLAGVEYAVGSSEDLKTYYVMGNPENPEEIVGRLLKAVIEPNIAYLRESLVVEEGGEIRRSKTVPALLPVIYSHLADAAVGEREYLKCQYERCGNYFSQKDPRQCYCPHPVDSKYESLCSLKARKHRLPDKPKTGRKGGKSHERTY